MSRTFVFVVVFLAVLPVLTISELRGADPPKNAGKMPASQKESADADNPFGDAGAAGPFSDPEELKLLRKPKVELAKPKVDLAKLKAASAKAKPHPGPKLHGGEKAILKALKRTTALEFTETPLKDVLEFLGDMHRIPLCIDSSALKEAGIDESTPITCNISGIPLRSALEMILDELRLKWTIHHDVLMITTSEKAESDAYMYTKFYDVTDLAATAKDYDVQNPLIPSVPENYGNYPMNMGATFGGGTSGLSFSGGTGTVPNDTRRVIAAGVGMAGAGFSGGMPAPSRMQPVSYDVSPIKDLLASTISPKSWQEAGGNGTMDNYEGMLVVSQTREVHTQIEQFLADLRARRQARPTLSVELHWLWLDAKQRDRLLAGRKKSSAGRLSLTVDPQRLRQIAAEVPGFHGRVACSNGIFTVVAAGDRRPVILSAIPVVGGPGEGDVGYQPVISVPNVGVTAQLRPTYVPGTKTAMLDIASGITRWGPSQPPALVGSVWPAGKQLPTWKLGPVSPPAQPAPAATPPVVWHAEGTRSTQGGSASCPIDQPVMPTQQIGSTLRVPLGKPVIVGSITFAPTGDAGLDAVKEEPEVYLIATTSIVRGVKPRAVPKHREADAGEKPNTIDRLSKKRSQKP